MIRPAGLSDLSALVAVENAAFDIDRFSRRSFRYLLTKAHALTLVYEEGEQVVGYVTLLFHHGTSQARMYSLAVTPQQRGKGLGQELISAAEQAALESDCISLRLEVRIDNQQAIQLYEKLGYRRFGTRRDYYEDHADALLYEKRLNPGLKPDLARVPFYPQSLEFTCGPASLMMAMKALDPEMEIDRSMELRLWRESTTIFMTSGHGGCGPYGLALSAQHLGFGVEIYVNEEGPMFLDSVRSAEKKKVMTLVHEDFLRELSSLPVVIHHGVLSVDALQEKFDQGGLPIVLISSYRIYREKFPHWVVVTGFDDKYIYVHDPYVDHEKGKRSLDSLNMPILRSEFEAMARYGKAAQRAVVILYQKPGTASKRGE